MTRSEDTLWCDGCGVEIRWSPYLRQGQEFCCEDCANGLVCKCRETVELEDDYRNTSILE